MSRDYRDLVIEQLEEDEAALLEQLVDTMIERDSWRAVAKAALHHLYQESVERERLRASHHQVIDEYRRFRAQTMRRTEAA